MEQFDTWSCSYDRSLLQRFLFWPSHRLLEEYLSPHDERILDIGCGTCQFAERILRRFPRVRLWGLDLSYSMLLQGRHRHHAWRDRLFIVRGNSQELPFCDDFFDVVTCSHSFHHYPDQAQALREMFRVLRPGGRSMIIDGNRDCPHGWLIFDILVTWYEGGVHHCSANEFRHLMAQAGFVHIVQRHEGDLIPYLLTMGVADKQTQRQVIPVRAAA